MCLVAIQTNNQVKLTTRKKSSKIYTLKSWSGLTTIIEQTVYKTCLDLTVGALK